MMSNASARSASTQNQESEEIEINGTRFRHCNMAKYHISNQVAGQDNHGSLINGGTNGGMLGSDVRVLEFVDGVTVDVTGINETKMTGLKVATGAGLTQTIEDGPIILIMLQYANHGSRHTIHSKGQMENFGILIDDKSRNAGGNQCVVTQEGYVIPLSIHDGLPCMDMRPP